MISQFHFKALREQRAGLYARLQKIGDAIRRDNRGMNTEERAEFDRIGVALTALNDQIRAGRAELDATARGLGLDTVGLGDRPPGSGHFIDPTVRAVAFQAWARAQSDLDLSDEQEEALERAGVSPRAKEFVYRIGRGGIERRDQGVGSGSIGGYTVAQAFSGQLDFALKAFGGVRRVAEVMRTDTGADMPWPSVDDTGNVGEIIGENTAQNQQDLTFGSVTYKAWKYSSKLMLFSNELLTDNAVILEDAVAGLAGERIGRAQGANFTTGTGTGQPQGVVTGATAGLTAASATAIAADEIIKLSHTVDPAYRAGPSCGFMMSDGILSVVALLKDSQGRPLFVPSYRDNPVDTIYGKPVFINQHMQATVATGTVTMLFGDFSRYKIRDVGDIRIRRLDERYAEKDQVGFIAFMRSDGRYINPAAVKKLTQA